jgi:hypothetical protein
MGLKGGFLCGLENKRILLIKESKIPFIKRQSKI